MEGGRNRSNVRSLSLVCWGINCTCLLQTTTKHPAPRTQPSHEKTNIACCQVLNIPLHQRGDCRKEGGHTLFWKTLTPVVKLVSQAGQCFIFFTKAPSHLSRYKNRGSPGGKRLQNPERRPDPKGQEGSSISRLTSCRLLRKPEKTNIKKAAGRRTKKQTNQKERDIEDCIVC